MQTIWKISPCYYEGKSKKNQANFTILQTILQIESFFHLIIRFKTRKYYMKSTICQLNFWRMHFYHFKIWWNLWRKYMQFCITYLIFDQKNPLKYNYNIHLHVSVSHSDSSFWSTKEYLLPLRNVKKSLKFVDFSCTTPFTKCQKSLKIADFSCTTPFAKC